MASIVLALNLKYILPGRLAQALGLLGSGRVLKLFSAAVMDQVVLSGANFLAGFVLIRFTSDHDYGLYVLVLTAQQLLVAVQRSWLSGPLAVIVARKSAAERTSNVGAVRAAQRSVLKRAVLALQLIPLAGYALGLLSAPAALLAAGALLSSWAALRREFLRDMLLLYARPYNLLAADTLFAVLLVLGVCAATRAHGTAILGTLACLYVAALAGAALADRNLAPTLGRAAGDARGVLAEIRWLGFWATVGSLTYWLYSQAFNYLLAARLDLKAVADVNATRLILMPAIVLTVGVQALLMPTAAVWYAQLGLASLTRRLLAFIAGMGLLDLAYLAVIWLSRDWLVGTVLHKQIAQRDELLILWALVALIGLVRDVLQCALFALGRMKSMAGQGAVCVVVALAVTWYGIGWWGAPAVLIGQIAAELINLAGIGMLLKEAHRRAERYSTP